jgi:hypothetical protein
MRHGATAGERTSAVIAAAAFVVIGVFAGCSNGGTSDSNTQHATTTDTTTMSTRVKDTAIVRHDTTVTVDTLKKTDHAKKAKKT